MSDALKEKWNTVSNRPGVYLMKDDKGKVIYVGKALNLRKRLSGYFNRMGQPDMKTKVLVSKIAAFDTIITETEKEALILESTLIKRHRPRYNVILKDDKRYPSLKLDIREPYPFLSIARKIARDGALYFGPFSNAFAVNQTLKLINKTFKLRKCKTKKFKNRSRPCLNYQMGTCLAPCCFDVPSTTYAQIVGEVTLFLNGRTPDLIKQIRLEMTALSDRQAFERAALLRDKIASLEKTLEKQVAVATDLEDRDVVAVADSPNLSVLTLLTVRGGYLQGMRHFSFSEIWATRSEMIETFIRQYYENNQFIPKQIFVSDPIDAIAILETELSLMKKRKVKIYCPQRGEKAKLLRMASLNAEKELKNQTDTERRMIDTLTRLSKRLRMSKIPIRIECFDNSNISGAVPVAGKVVFYKGKPDKAAYRKYKIKTVEGADDYTSMQEVLARRFRKKAAPDPLPDLLMVDGGKGQLNIAVSIIHEMGLADSFAVIGIAKKDMMKGEPEDKIYQPGRANPVQFGREGDLLLFLQNIRDEAHRFAISFHRSRRSRVSLRSSLDNIPGVGQKRKKVLFKHFKTLKNIQAATLDEMSALPGMNLKVAEAIKRHLPETMGKP